MGIKKGASVLWHSELSLHQLGSRPTVFIPLWTTHPCILYQACATRGAAVVVVEASAPKVYPRVTLASANTLSGPVVRTLSDGEELPNMFCPPYTSAVLEFVGGGSISVLRMRDLVEA